MKNDDPIMQDVQQAKEANAKKHQSFAAYVVYLHERPRQTQPCRRAGGGPILTQLLLSDVGCA